MDYGLMVTNQKNRMNLVCRAMHKMDSDDQLIFTFDGKQCIDEVNYVEHAVVITSYEASFRGAVQVELTSPNGFTSILMRPRFKDNSSAPLLTWPFVSFLHWGERNKNRFTCPNIWLVVPQTRHFEDDITSFF